MTENDQSVIGRLIVQHRTTIYGYILACVRNHNDAEDIFQEVAAVVVASFDKLNEESDFLPWAREIARRQVLSFFRKSTRSMLYESEIVDLLAEASVGNAKEGDTRTQALRDCLDGLPQRSKEIIQLRYEDTAAGVETIALRLGRSMSATYGVLKRIRMTLRTCVETRLASEDLA